VVTQDRLLPRLNDPIEASRQLRVFRAVLASGGRLIVGFDLKKDAVKLVRAMTTEPA